METKVISSGVSKRIVKEEDLLELHNISLDEWEIEKKIVNTWESASRNKKGDLEIHPLFQVKLWLRNKIPAKTLEEIRKEFVEDLTKLSPKVPSKSFNFFSKKGKKQLLQINLFDLHLGKISWDEETGQNYNIEEACKVFNNAVDYFLEKTQIYNVERILLPIGNDFFNSDRSHPFNSTTKGTPQEEDNRWQNTFRTGRELIVRNALKLSETAPVDIIMVPGNHDLEKNFYLGDSLQGWFSNNKNINVDNSPSTRKYYTYNNILLGFTHGDSTKIQNLPLVMAQEKPTEWANAKYREIHIGHFHRKKDMVFSTIDEATGVKIRYMSSLSATDSWHHSKGFIGSGRTGECFLWDTENGLQANLFFNV